MLPFVGISLLFLLPGSLPRPVDAPGPYTVGRITIEQHQVFDESDSSLIQPVEKLANGVHIMTQEDVIRRELLFKEGDSYDQYLVDESARHLRKMRIIGDVHIIADTLPDNTVDLKVLTRDRWTLSPSLGLRAGGGVHGFSVGVKEENLFGGGQKLNVGYNRLSDRANPNGGEIGFTEPRLFSSWWSTTLQYRDADELTMASVDLQRPLYADAAEWAMQGHSDIGRVRIRQYENGLVLRDDYLNQENQFLWLASSTGSDTKLQLATSYVRTRATSDSFQVRPFDNVDLVIASIGILHRGFSKQHYVENFGRTEDVPVGYQAGVAVGRNLHLSSVESVDYFMRLFGQESVIFGGEVFSNYKASVTSYFIGNTPNEMTVSATALHYWRLTPNQTLLGRVTTTIGSHWAPSSQITLGSFSGLRGYRSNEFDGQRLLVMNLEHRMFSAVSLWFFRLGTALFFDSGVVWNEGEGLYGKRFHSAAGFGIQIESGKNVGNGIFRLDFAYNLDQRRIALVLSSDHLFRAFSDMEFVPPLPSAQF